MAGEAGDWGKKSEWQVAYTDEEILDLRPIVGVHEDSVHGVNSSVEKGDWIFTAAIDLGTTTIVGYLLDGRTGENLAVESRMNPQMQYGGDVIQRANYALEHGTETLSKCVQKTINKILESLIVKTQKAPKIASGRKKVNDQTVNGKTKNAEWMPGVEDIYQVSLVGNTYCTYLYSGCNRVYDRTEIYCGRHDLRCGERVIWGAQRGNN